MLAAVLLVIAGVWIVSMAVVGTLFAAVGRGALQEDRVRGYVPSD